MTFHSLTCQVPCPGWGCQCCHDCPDTPPRTQPHALAPTETPCCATQDTPEPLAEDRKRGRIWTAENNAPPVAGKANGGRLAAAPTDSTGRERPGMKIQPDASGYTEDDARTQYLIASSIRRAKHQAARGSARERYAAVTRRDMEIALTVVRDLKDAGVIGGTV